MLIYLNSGECIEVQDATTAERRNGSLVCLDERGRTTATFQASDVESFTANEEIAEAMKEEVCEDLTVVSDGKVVAEERESDPAG